jgi:hypothetical protein
VFRAKIRIALVEDRTIDDFASTMAHEIGHFVIHMHGHPETAPEMLMRDGGHGTKITTDLTLSYLNAKY